MHRVRRLLEMIRFSHTLFALPFALFSAVLAWHKKGVFPSRGMSAAIPAGSWTNTLLEFAGILLCMVFARSAAMAFNRLADRRLDAANPRTAMRHLSARQLSVAAVWGFTLICAAGFIASTFLFYLAEPSNPWPSFLAVPVLLFICAYSYTKRFTALAHFWLGAALLLAPVAAWIAILGPDHLEIPGTLGLAVLFWVAGFDIIYACQDAEHDRQANLHSIPAKIGVGPALRVALGCHLVMLGLLVALYFLANPPLGIVYLVAVAAVAALLIYEHSLVRPTDLTRVNQAFFQVNAVISIGLFVVALVEAWLAR